MRIIKGTKPSPVEHPVFLIFGQPGIGKSSLGYSAHDPLTLDFDRGAHRAANRRDTLVIDTWASVTELTEHPEVLAPYASIVVDTVGRCLDLMSADIIAGNPKLGRDGNLSLQGYGVLKSRFRLFVAQLRTLGKDVILLAHDKETNDGDVTIVRPDITGGSFAEVMKVSDFVGYLSMTGKHRVLDFSPSDRWIGKNPGGWLPLTLPPVGKAQSVLAELIDNGRAALGAISEQSSAVALQVDDWRAAVATFTTVEEINRAIPETQKLSAILAPQAKKLLTERAKALGFNWSQAAKAYVQPQPQTVSA